MSQARQVVVGHYLLSDASFPFSYRIIVDTLQMHRIDKDELLVKDLATSLLSKR